MKKRILSGMRPTGKLHLGNYVGALENWIRLQQEYESYHMIADWHMLTTDLTHTSEIPNNSVEVITDWLSAGLDPEKSPLFIQSHIKEHTELHLLFSMLITVPRLQRNPTVKEQARDLGLENNMSYGHLGYPILQAADILAYKADAVPVGEDQAPHVEITREIARRFNNLYGNVFPEPETLLTKFARLPGLDGRKMSNSFQSAVYLRDDPKIIRKKIAPMVTDTKRKRKADPGEPEDCPVFTLHKAFVEEKTRKELAEGCRTAGIGCLECKNVLIESLIQTLNPYWDKRKEFDKHPQDVWDILEEGNKKARQVARRTMEEVRTAIGL